MKHAPRSLFKQGLHTIIFTNFLGIVLLGAAAGNAFAQCDWKTPGCQRQTVEGTRRTSSSGSKSSSRSDPAEEAREQRRSEAIEANNAGIAFQKAGDHAKAIAAFQEAADKLPDDEIIRKNLANAKTWLEDQLAKERAAREAEERKRMNKAAADNMLRSIQNFAKTLYAAPSTEGLDFAGVNSRNAPSRGRLDFISTAPTPSAAKPAAALEFGDPMAVDALPQLREVKAASENGANTSGEAAKPLIGHRFDTPEGPPASDLPLVVLPRPGNWEQIPKRLQNDPEFKAMAKQWQELESQERTVDTQLAKVNEEKSKPGADKSKLEMLEAGLKEERNQVGYKKLIVEKKISFAVDVAEKEEALKAPMGITSTPAKPPPQ